MVLNNEDHAQSVGLGWRWGLRRIQLTTLELTLSLCARACKDQRTALRIARDEGKSDMVLLLESQMKRINKASHEKFTSKDSLDSVRSRTFGSSVSHSIDQLNSTRKFGQ